VDSTDGETSINSMLFLVILFHFISVISSCQTQLLQCRIKYAETEIHEIKAAAK